MDKSASFSHQVVSCTLAQVPRSVQRHCSGEGSHHQRKPSILSHVGKAACLRESRFTVLET